MYHFSFFFYFCFEYICINYIFIQKYCSDKEVLFQIEFFVTALFILVRANHPLRKQALAIYRDFFGCKNKNVQLKKFDIFLTFVQNKDCGYMLEPPRRGVCNKYPQSMFWIKNKKKCIPLHTPVLLHTCELKYVGIHFTEYVFLMYRSATWWFCNGMTAFGVYTPQPLYNTIVGVQDNFRVSYPIHVITRVKYIDIKQI